MRLCKRNGLYCLEEIDSIRFITFIKTLLNTLKQLTNLNQTKRYY